MLYFPQLATGATAQFPLERRLIRRTIVNRMADGTLVKLDDPKASGIAWTMQFQGLSDTERAAIETLFSEAEGRLGSFIFLDPAGNLLTWSEDLDKSAWHKDGSLQIMAGVADPMGTERAARIVNGAQITQSIQQTIDTPGWLRYCFSVTARCAESARVQLAISNATGTISTEETVGINWRVLSCSGEPGDTAEDVTCRLSIEAGCAVEVFGFQLNAQLSPPGYKRTNGKAGVHTDSRFLDDELKFIANGIDDHAVTLRVFSRTES